MLRLEAVEHVLAARLPYNRLVGHRCGFALVTDPTPARVLDRRKLARAWTRAGCLGVRGCPLRSGPRPRRPSAGSRHRPCRRRWRCPRGKGFWRSRTVQRPDQEGSRKVNANNAVQRVSVSVGDRNTASMVAAHLLGEIADRTGLSCGYSTAVPWTGERAPGQDPGRLFAQVSVMLAPVAAASRTWQRSETRPSPLADGHLQTGCSHSVPADPGPPCHFTDGH